MGKKLITESMWAAQPLHIPAINMYCRLAFKFEGMTDMINGASMEDLSDLLNSITGDQRRCNTSYEIDTEFEKMSTSQGRGEETWGPLRPAELGWRRSSAPSVRPAGRETKAGRGLSACASACYATTGGVRPRWPPDDCALLAQTAASRSLPRVRSHAPYPT